MSNFKLELQRIGKKLKISGKNSGDSDDPLYLALVGFSLALNDEHLYDVERLLMEATAELVASPEYEDRQPSFIDAVSALDSGLGDKAEFTINITAEGDGDINYQLEQGNSYSVIPFMTEALLYASHNFESDRDKKLVEGFVDIAIQKSVSDKLQGGNAECLH